MKSVMNSVKAFVLDEEGPTAVEYAVMLALIIVVCLVSIRLIGSNANAMFDEAADAVDSVTSSP